MSERQERPSELRERTDDELHTLARSLSEDLFRFRVQRYTNQLENTMKIRNARRMLARVHTILTARTKGLEARRTQAAPTEQKE
jgi:large subunit ribosomal protein L29